MVPAMVSPDDANDYLSRIGNVAMPINALLNVVIPPIRRVLLIEPQVSNTMSSRPSSALRKSAAQRKPAPSRRPKAKTVSKAGKLPEWNLAIFIPASMPGSHP